jgi:aromatic ring-opening dioxygenase catalytic subunit (LigB family)
MTTRLPTYFVSHGGGPWPWMKDQYGGAYDKLEASLVDMKRQAGARPKAVLVVTSHWETDAFTCLQRRGARHDLRLWRLPAAHLPDPATRRRATRSSRPAWPHC